MHIELLIALGPDCWFEVISAWFYEMVVLITDIKKCVLIIFSLPDFETY